MTENTSSPVRLRRLAAGEYATADGRYHISHIVGPDEGDGYGARDYWVVVGTDGNPWDPMATLADVRAEIARETA